MSTPAGSGEKPGCSIPSISQSDESQSQYSGKGTAEDPFIVEWRPDDKENPLNFSDARKWLITSIVTASVFAVALTSSAYTSFSEQVQEQFGTNSELFLAGVALFVLGFAIGPAVWAPLSELYGRKVIFIVSHGVMTGFIGAAAGSTNIAQLLVFRFFAGIFGASPLTNSGGTIADVFPASKRGLAMSLFATAPFMGPTVGPIIGGFMTITVGWRWVQGFCCIFVGVIWAIGTIILPETYGPVLLERRAAKLSKETGQVYISVLEKDKTTTVSHVFNKSILRPWVLLSLEPIVLIASSYLAILYGILYMFFAAFPIVYEEGRGWDSGIGSLSFLGLVAGMMTGLIYCLADDVWRYQKLCKNITPESRLPQAMSGAVALPIGMFAFAWTNYPSIHWSASIILSSPFGFGMVAVFISLFNYLLDSYTIYAASVLAAGAILRSLLGAAFPLFTTYMYRNLGNHWASSIPAFLTLLMLPFPFVMYNYGEKVRMKCKYSAESAQIIASMSQGSKLPAKEGKQEHTEENEA
ncbi:MFS transporter [Penicillium atrosanguineum]|uniref:MFS transporter n=1 Tax=Penicillium atrosanguineum TaxID=1132637 RepID=A0A9W9Q292_9EURO|nr:MFS transporter [Penicillium atrosanguineum]